MLSRLICARTSSILSKQVIRYFYDTRSKYDTIFAPATSIDFNCGSPLGVIRVSGKDTEKILYKFTKHTVTRQYDVQNPTSSTGKRLLRPRHATLTKIIQPITGELIDMGLVVWFPKPNSYTGEDTCEFHLHGSQAIIKSMMNHLGNMPGLRPAEAGEFTRRALLNGKMSLIQAESLPDLIASKTDHQRRLALKGLDGVTLKRYASWTEDLTGILAHLEASIDFGEDELIGEREVVENCVSKLRRLASEIHQFVERNAHCREVIQSGVRAAILGKPNSGKSTFMNMLCRRDRSIVSDLSGTTRDVVEHNFELGGHALTLCDTAGLKDISLDAQKSSREQSLLEQHESVEREGIRRAIEAAKNAHLIFYLIDGSSLIGSKEEKDKILEELDGVLRILSDGAERKLVHLVINKLDLNTSFVNNASESVSLSELVATRNVETSFISCKSGLNFEKLMCELIEKLDTFCGLSEKSTCDELSHVHEQQKSWHGNEHFDYVNERHLSLLKSTQKHLNEASQMNLSTIDEMAQHVRESIDYLSRIVGSISNDEIIDIIFRDFCIGK